MSISVVMPNFNHGEWLPMSLAALLRQEPRAREIIVVDDGSSDDSVAIVERLARVHPSLRLIRHETNRGVIAAMNTGLEAAGAEFVFFAAADDCVLPGFFARAEAAMHAHPAAALYCSDLVMVDRDNRVLGFRPFMVPVTSPAFISAGEVRRGLYRSDNWFTGPAAVYRRERLVELGGFDPSLNALSDGLTGRLLAVRHGFFFDTAVGAAWRVYPESLSARSALSDAESLRLIALAETRIDEKFPAEFRERYRVLFVRRLRFNMARLRMVWGGGPDSVQRAARLLAVPAWEAALLNMLARLPALGRLAALAWMALRMRPFAPTAVLAGWWRNVTVNRARRASVQQLVEEAAAARIG
jgi:glycosyltransferase involved in cell wall biosynthesis